MAKSLIALVMSWGGAGAQAADAELRVGSLAAPAVFRVCADPNNLPFSNRRAQGFENKIAALLARSLGAKLQYTWWAQRRGFLRNTLRARSCDVVVGVPANIDAHQAMPTRPYYRSSYVFAQRRGGRAIRSFDDPALRRLRVGVPLVGDDGANPPPELALARRGVIDNVAGFSLYGNYARPDPGLDPLRALAAGKIDVAVVWGPLAGYFERSRRLGLIISPVQGSRADDSPFTYEIALGVRPGDDSRRRLLDDALQTQRPAIERILHEYGVPRL